MSRKQEKDDIIDNLLKKTKKFEKYADEYARYKLSPLKNFPGSYSLGGGYGEHTPTKTKSPLKEYWHSPGTPRRRYKSGYEAFEREGFEEAILEEQTEDVQEPVHSAPIRHANFSPQSNQSSSTTPSSKGIQSYRTTPSSESTKSSHTTPSTQGIKSSHTTPSPKDSDQSPQDALSPFSIQSPQGALSPQSPQSLQGSLSPSSPQYLQGTLSPRSPQYLQGTLSPRSPQFPQGILSPRSPQFPQGILSPRSPQSPQGAVFPHNPQSPQETLSPRSPSTPQGMCSPSITLSPQITLSPPSPPSPQNTLSPPAIGYQQGMLSPNTALSPHSLISPLVTTQPKVYQQKYKGKYEKVGHRYIIPRYTVDDEFLHHWLNLKPMAPDKLHELKLQWSDDWDNLTHPPKWLVPEMFAVVLVDEPSNIIKKQRYERAKSNLIPKKNVSERIPLSSEEREEIANKSLEDSLHDLYDFYVQSVRLSREALHSRITNKMLMMSVDIGEDGNWKEEYARYLLEQTGGERASEKSWRIIVDKYYAKFDIEKMGRKHGRNCDTKNYSVECVESLKTYEPLTIKID